LFKAFQKLSTNFLVFDFDQTKTYELVSKKNAEDPVDRNRAGIPV